MCPDSFSRANWDSRALWGSLWRCVSSAGDKWTTHTQRKQSHSTSKRSYYCRRRGVIWRLRRRRLLNHQYFFFSFYAPESIALLLSLQKAFQNFEQSDSLAIELVGKPSETHDDDTKEEIFQVMWKLIGFYVCLKKSHKCALSLSWFIFRKPDLEVLIFEDSSPFGQRTIATISRVTCTSCHSTKKKKHDFYVMWTGHMTWYVRPKMALNAK